MNDRRRRRPGFTLIEVLLVVLILSMLAGVAIFAFSGVRESAKVDTTKLTIAEVETALDAYNMAIGHYPSDEEGGLKALLEKPAFADEALAEKWRERFLKREPKDAWGNALNYELVTETEGTTTRTRVRIWSNGPDGQSQTEDDIKNWTEETP